MYLQRKNADMPVFLHEKGKKNPTHLFIDCFTLDPEFNIC